MVNKYITDTDNFSCNFPYWLPGWRFWRWLERIHKLAPGPQIPLHDRHPPRAWMRYWRTSDFSSGLGWPWGSGSTSTSTKLNSSSLFRRAEIGVVNIFEINRNRMLIVLSNRNRCGNNVLATEMKIVCEVAQFMKAGANDSGSRWKGKAGSTN